MTRIEELIKRYDIFAETKNGIQTGRIGIRYADQAKKDCVLDEIKEQKQNILQYFNDQKAREEAEWKAREEKIAGIEGLAEIKAAKEALKKWHDDFNRSFEDDFGGQGVGKKPEYDFNAAYKRYPRAAAYLKAESMEYRTGGASIIGRKAKERIINGEDPEIVLADMEKEHSAYIHHHMWD